MATKDVGRYSRRPAPTKAEHDAFVERRGRSYTDDAVRPRPGSALPDARQRSAPIFNQIPSRQPGTTSS